MVLTLILNDLRFFRSPPFSGAAIVSACAFLSLGGFLFLNTLYLQDVRGYSRRAEPNDVRLFLG